MKRFIMMFLVLVLALSVGACQKVPAGNVGVKVYLLGGDKGVESEELSIGRYWIGINEELYLFPTFTQNYVWTMDEHEGSRNNESITFQSIQGMSLNADVGISYHIDGDHVNTIFQKYRKGIGEITDIFLRNMVRDAFVAMASTKNIEEIYGRGKMNLVKEVEDMVKSQVDPIGIRIERIYLIGEMRLPPAVVTALNAKIEATQRAQQRENEVREAKAEAQKTVAKADGEARSILKVAEAQAQANIKLAKSLTPELVQYKAIEVWNGELPKFTGGGAVPIINMSSLNK